MRACPRDAAGLVLKHLNGLNVLRCPACSGLWLPPSAYASELGRSGQVAAQPAAALNCPDDQAKLRIVCHHGVEIDVCNACGGVWLDAGELERLLRAQRRTGIGKTAYELLPAPDNPSQVLELAGDATAAVLEFVVEALTSL